MEKTTIIRNFSRFAHSYDAYSEVQKRSANLLLEELQEDELNRILEIGCGTGNFTILLTNKFKHAYVKAVDICEEMIEVASKKLKDKRIEFVVSDAQHLNLQESFDLITSNACLHWFDNLDEALANYKKLLKKDAVIYFSIFGPHTFWELKESLKHVLKNAVLSSDNFLDKKTVMQVMQKHFSKISLKEVVLQEKNKSLKELLQKIKYTGVRGNGIGKNMIFTPSLMDKLEKCYFEKFKEIQVTYQVFICKAKL